MRCSRTLCISQLILSAICKFCIISSLPYGNNRMILKGVMHVSLLLIQAIHSAGRSRFKRN